MQTGTIIFWQNMVSPHQVPFIEGIARISGRKVILVVQETMLSERRDLGWEGQTVKGVEIVLANNKEIVRHLLEGAGMGSLHILGGFRGQSFTEEVIKACRKWKQKVITISEGCNSKGLIGAGRQVLYRYLYAKYRDDIDFMMVMGENGKAWFRKAGWPDNRLFTFGYVTTVDPPAKLPETILPNRAGEVQLLFVGQLIPRKGLDRIILALGRSGLKNIDIDVIGDGPQHGEWVALAERVGVGSYFHFHGVRPNTITRSSMQKADYLLLPSRFDGWGAVVNEAMIMGTPVVCSQECGARDLVESSGLGMVVSNGGERGWDLALQALSQAGKTTGADRERLRQFSTRLSGESLAQYFLGVVDYVHSGSPKPVLPWKAP
jgi:glycosyltransferase involved in cell wall biosynthesis